MPWFRMYADFMTDPEVEELAFEDQRHFVFVLCMKCAGLLDKDFADDEQRERAIARRLGLHGEAFTNAKARLVESRLIDSDWQPRSWDRLQFLSDHDPTRAERQRRWRERRKSNALRNGRVTPLEQNRTDTEQRREVTPPPAGLDFEAWNRWETYRREIRKPIKPASVQAAQRKLAGFGADQADVVEQSIAQGWTGLFALKEQGNGARRPSSQPRPSAVERVRRATEAWLRDGDAESGGGVVIDG